MAYTWTWPGGCWSTLLLPMLPSGQGGSIVSLVGWGPRFQKKGVHQTNKNVFYETLRRVISDRTLRPRGVRGFGPLFLFGGIWRGNARDMAWHSVFHFVVTVAGFEGSFVGVAGALVFRMPECTKRTKTSSTKHCVVLLEKTMTLRGTEGHPGFWKLVPPRDMAYPWTWPGGCWSTLLLLRLPSGQRGSIFRALLFSECRSSPNKQNIFNKTSCDFLLGKTMRPRGIQGFGRRFLRGLWHTPGPGREAVAQRRQGFRFFVWVDGALVVRSSPNKQKHLQQNTV